MTLQIFLQIFSSHVCNIPPIHVAALSRLCPQPTAHRRCATNLTTLPLTPSHRYPSPQRIGDALFFRNPIRTERSGGRMGSQATHTTQRFADALLPHQPDRALRTSSPIAVVRNPTARAVTLSVNPRQRRGHTHRCRCAAERRR